MGFPELRGKAQPRKQAHVVLGSRNPTIPTGVRSGKTKERYPNLPLPNNKENEGACSQCWQDLVAGEAGF